MWIGGVLLVPGQNVQHEMQSQQTIYVRTKRSKCVGELENSQYDFVRECLVSTFHLGGDGFGLSWLQLIFAMDEMYGTAKQPCNEYRNDPK